jgi:Putative auto-transporter adhesin, head GIN domain
LRRGPAALLVLAAGMLAAGCDSGPPVSQTRAVESFSSLEVDGSLDLEVSLFNRPEPGVHITAGENAIDRIETEVVDGTLRISTKSRGLTIGPDPLGDVSIRLGVPALSGLRVEGSADVLLRGLSAKAFVLRATGSGDVEAHGRVDDLEVEIDGSANTDLSKLSAQNALIRIDGSGNTDLRVARSLELVVEGSANVTYRGSPIVSSRLEGSGDVRQVQE